MKPPDCPEPDRMPATPFRTLKEARNALLSSRDANEELSALTLAADEHGRLSDGGDALAALVVLRSMGVKDLRLEGTLAPPEAAGLLARMEEALADPHVFALASEREVYFADNALLELNEPIECGPRLDEDIISGEDSLSGILTLFIENDDGLDSFCRHAYLISAPLCLRCPEAELLEQALRFYPGRVLFDNSEEIPDDALVRLRKLYGMLVLQLDTAALTPQ